MIEDRPTLIARISAEMSASADLDGVCRWLIGSQCDPVRLDVADLPALGHHSRLRIALLITAPRALICTLWLVEDVDAGACLLAGHLRFVAHPTASAVRLSFDGRTARAPRPAMPAGQTDNVARQLLELITGAIERPHTGRRFEMRPQAVPISAAG